MSPVVEPERGEQHEAGEQLEAPGAELGDRGHGPAAGVAEDDEALAHLDQRAPDRGDRPRDAARPVLPHERGGQQHRDQDRERSQADEEELLGLGRNRSVEPTMITPRITRASRFSADWETSVPSSTGKLPHAPGAARQHHRAGGLAERAGSVADIRTPTIVAEVTSRRRRGKRGRRRGRSRTRRPRA